MIAEYILLIPYPKIIATQLLLRDLGAYNLSYYGG